MYVRKGGSADDAAGRACLCNALSADVGLGQTRPDGRTEEALVTLGADLDGARRLAELHPDGWSADQVLDWLLPPGGDSGRADRALLVPDGGAARRRRDAETAVDRGRPSS